MSQLLPYETIVKASEGDPEAVAAAVFFSVVVFAGVASVAAAVVFFVLGIFISS